MIGGIEGKPGSGELCDRRCNIKTKHPHAIGERIARRVFAGKRREICIEFNERDAKPFEARLETTDGADHWP